MTATLPEAAVATSLREVAHDIPVPEGYRVEIIGGTIVASPTPTGMHGRMLWRLVEMMMPHLPDGYEIENNLGVGKAPGSEDFSIPDLFVAPGEVLETWHTEIPPAEVLFVAEVVSRSSRIMDRVAKAKQYAESGVPLYLLVDPFEEELVLHSDPGKGTYRARHAVPWAEKLQLPEPLPVLIDGSRFPSLDERPRP